MKPQTGEFIAGAEESLSEARAMLTIKLSRQAARMAYYTQFHAAQALIFEVTGQVAKTHKGVRTLFHKIALTDVQLSKGYAVQLTNAFQYKETADYEFGAGRGVTSEVAAQAIAVAEDFLASVTQTLARIES